MKASGIRQLRDRIDADVSLGNDSMGRAVVVRVSVKTSNLGLTQDPDEQRVREALVALGDAFKVIAERSVHDAVIAEQRRAAERAAREARARKEKRRMDVEAAKAELEKAVQAVAS